MLKTAECVTPKHPDKLCDQISDAILDACLEQDPMSRVAIETMGGHGIITITGELTTKAYVNIREVVKKIVGDKYGVQVNVVEQSPEIANGVDTGGAGDQGIMVGYACKDNPAMIPQELYLARSLAKFIYEKYPYDGKTQITLDDNGLVHTIVASFQKVSKEELEKEVMDWVYIHEDYVRKGLKMHCNPAGDWIQGGFEADTGVTGRKLAVDNYGPQVNIGGGAFSGKDATKVDRSAAYMARSIAVSLLKGTDAEEVVVKLAYAIGIADPVMATATLKTKSEVKDIDLLQMQYGGKGYMQPNRIIETLELRKPQFKQTAEWGHFGNDFKWDK